MQVTAEGQVNSERFLKRFVVPLDAYLTDDMVRHNGLYNMNETEWALLTERQTAEIAARAVAVEGDSIVVDQKVSSDITDLNASISGATDPSSKKRKVSRPVSPSKRLFPTFDRVSKKKRLVDSLHYTFLYSGSIDRDLLTEDRCSLQEAKEMKLALERSVRDTIRPLDDGEKKLLSAYGGLDAVKCSNDDPRSLDDRMLQLTVV